MLQGDLDQHSALQVKDIVDGQISLHPRLKRLLFDMQDVSFMDSSGIGVIIGRYKNMARRGGCTEVTNTAQRVDRIFRMSGLYQLVEHV